MVSTFLLGSEGTGWSIDYDRNHTEMFLMNLGHDVTSNPLSADLVHAVWWNKIVQYRTLPLQYKPVLAVVTNEVDTDSSAFERGRDVIDLWVAPSDRAYEKLDAAGVDVTYQPFYVDERVFRDLDADKQALCADLGIDDSLLEDRFVVGSFQRDSLGKDLSSPKWQKNPELLVEIMDRLPADDVVLLLAGPRRHWIIDQCEQRDIPYVFYGEDPEPGVDDLSYNIWGKWVMNKLYNLIDLYVVPSESEGGPKSVLEAAWTNTHIVSTDVGLAPDVLDDWYLYATADEAVEKIESLMAGEVDAGRLETNHENVVSRAGYAAMTERWQRIYDHFETRYL